MKLGIVLAVSMKILTLFSNYNQIYTEILQRQKEAEHANQAFLYLQGKLPDKNKL